MSLEIARLELQITKVSTAKSEMEFTIMEKEEEIKRLRKQIDVQDETIKKLTDMISDIKGDKR